MCSHITSSVSHTHGKPLWFLAFGKVFSRGSLLGHLYLLARIHSCLGFGTARTELGTPHRRRRGLDLTQPSLTPGSVCPPPSSALRGPSAAMQYSRPWGLVLLQEGKDASFH